MTKRLIECGIILFSCAALIVLLSLVALCSKPAVASELPIEDSHIWHWQMVDYPPPEEPEPVREPLRGTLTVEVMYVPPALDRTAGRFVGMSDEEIRQLRFNTEGGGYGYFDGTYVGGYGFAVEYLDGRLAAAGMPPMTVDEFRNSPEAQDHLADYYAQDRYGGWENTPGAGSGW